MPLALPAQVSCRAVFSFRKTKDPQVDKFLPNHLTNYYKYEIEGLSKEKIADLNAKTLSDFQNEIPPLNENRAQAVPYKSLTKILKILRSENYFANHAGAEYGQEGREIGYCFGRAAFVHLILLKMGLQNESMKKIWLLGPHQLPGQEVEWGFHVATAIYTKEKGWVTVDTLDSKPLAVQFWVASQLSHSTDERARIYVTSPDKFSADLGRYERIQLGLDLNREEDWYRHYFVDELRFIRENSLRSLGLKPLERPNGKQIDSEEPKTVRGRIQELLQEIRFW